MSVVLGLDAHLAPLNAAGASSPCTLPAVPAREGPPKAVSLLGALFAGVFQAFAQHKPALGVSVHPKPILHSGTAQNPC